MASFICYPTHKWATQMKRDGHYCHCKCPVHPSTNLGDMGVIPCPNRLNDTTTVSDRVWLIKTQLDLFTVK